MSTDMTDEEMVAEALFNSGACSIGYHGDMRMEQCRIHAKAVIAALAPSVRPADHSSLQPSAVRQTKLAEQWRSPLDTPPTPVGQNRYYIVAVRRGHNGQVYSFPALHLNQMLLEDPETYEEHPASGWFTGEADEDNLATYRVLLDDKKDELVAWCEVPQFGADEAAPIGIGAGGASQTDSTPDLEAVKAALEELVAACEAEFAGPEMASEPDDEPVAYPSSRLTFGMIRRARQALAAMEGR